MMDLTVTYNQVELAAMDYAKIIDCEFKPLLQNRYEMLVRLMQSYNAAYRRRDEEKLVLIGAVGEPFELKFVGFDSGLTALIRSGKCVCSR